MITYLLILEITAVENIIWLDNQNLAYILQNRVIGVYAGKVWND